MTKTKPCDRSHASARLAIAENFIETNLSRRFEATEAVVARDGPSASATRQSYRWRCVAQRRRRPSPTSWPDDGQSLRMVQERLDREAHARERVDAFRADMDEAARILKSWAAGLARSRQAEWHGYEAATRLIEVELGREAIAVARTRIRAGVTLEQAVRHAIDVTEELAVDVVQRVGLLTDDWVPRRVADHARDADRRRRIERLRAKADSTGFPEEAASFRAKADELALKYGFSCRR